MAQQLGLFDNEREEFYLRDKKIRLITLFSGYDSQALALKYLNVPFEHYKTCEWGIPSILALYDLHFNDIDHKQETLLDFDTLCDFYTDMLSNDWNNPMSYNQVKRLGEEKLREIDFAVRNSNNLVNICKVKGSDLEIVDKDKYNYVLTYTFPCQDLSLSGTKTGMAEGSGTRSSLLWEVGRILDELKEQDALPQMLLMENVPQVLEKQNIKEFAKWIEKLEKLGYCNYEKVLNAKDFGVPQNRARCYMVSLLGQYNYYFPEPPKTKVALLDVLEEEVDEKYYLSKKALYGALHTNYWKATLGQRLPRDEDGTTHTLQAKDDKDAHLVMFDKKTGEYYDPTKDKDNLISYWGNYHTHTWEDRNQTYSVIASNGKTRQTKKHPDKTGLIPYGTYYTWQDSKGNINTQCNRACDPSQASLTIATEVIPQVLIESSNKRLLDTAEKLDLDNELPQYLDCYNKKISTTTTTTTITTRVDESNEDFIYTKYRIRKLTPKECFRLMGVKDEDYNKIAPRQNDRTLYHMAGDSIVVDVLMAIFKEVL